jgi:acyl-CoA synthetase (AMP-forming)/AMP-acid ligase II
MGITQPMASSDRLVYFLVSTATEAEIIDYCKINLPSVWRPDKVIFLDQIPRTRTGKPDLTKLAQMV